VAFAVAKVFFFVSASFRETGVIMLSVGEENPAGLEGFVSNLWFNDFSSLDCLEGFVEKNNGPQASKQRQRSKVVIGHW
jgi:hypothetical protein